MLIPMSHPIYNAFPPLMPFLLYLFNSQSNSDCEDWFFWGYQQYLYSCLVFFQVHSVLVRWFVHYSFFQPSFQVNHFHLRVTTKFVNLIRKTSSILSFKALIAPCLIFLSLIQLYSPSFSMDFYFWMGLIFLISLLVIHVIKSISYLNCQLFASFG